VSVASDLNAVERRVVQIAGDAPPTALARPSSRAFSNALDDSPALLIRRQAGAAGVDPALVTAIVANESAFDPRAISAAGAGGLMQLMPATAISLGVTDRFDPAQNVRAGATYLRYLLERFGNDVPSALAAYNAGPAAVERWHGVPPYPETRRYVARVLADYRALSQR